MSQIVERAYRQQLPIFNTVQISLMSELESPQLLRYSGANIYRVSSRLKTLESLLAKLTRRNIAADEQALSQINDLVGARIVCMFQEDLERIHYYISSCGAFRLCEKPRAYVWDGMEWLAGEEFNIERKSSGYGAIHYIAQFSTDLVGENNPAGLIKFEIQVRTLMQEAWAALEHSVGYKNEIPDRIRGYFDSAADLLGLIDRAFQRLKHESNRLQNDMDRERMTSGVPINFYTLKLLAEQELGARLAGRNFSDLLKVLLESPLKTIEAARLRLNAPGYRNAVEQAYQTALERPPAPEDLLRWLPLYNPALKTSELSALIVKRLMQTDGYRKQHAQRLLVEVLCGLDCAVLAEAIAATDSVVIAERNILIAVSDTTIVERLRQERERLLYGCRQCFGPVLQILVNNSPLL